MSTYDTLIANDGAVAHWPLDEASGTLANDVIAHGHDATLYHAPVQGVAGPVSGQTATSFSAHGGHTPYASITSPATLPSVAGACSLECWVQIPGTATDNSTPFSVANNTTSFTGYFMALQTGTPTSIFVGRYANAASTDDAGADAPGLMNNAWHHVVFTNAGGGGASSLYLDGVALTLSFSDPFVTSVSVDAGLLAADAEGYDPATNYEGRFTGALAHVAVYPLALSACQVLSHYDLATTGSYTPCGAVVRRRPNTLVVVQ